MHRRTMWAVGGILAAALCLLAPLGSEARIVLGILVLAMVWWIGEVLPLAITGLAASLLLIVVARRPAVDVFAVYFDPIIVLLLGGFVMGVALSRHGLDVALAGWLMRRAGTRPSVVLLALMTTTATFSMWISNTASTAMMLPVALGIVAGNAGRSDNLARALVLGVAFAANIGGIATPIGTTANPIALRFLAEAGIHVTFLGWMVRTVPLALLMILVLWRILLIIYPPGPGQLHTPGEAPQIGATQRWVMTIFAITVVLWLTTDLHGIAASTVALLPIIALFGTRLLDEQDIGKAGWPTLLLIGSGLALGDAISATGLDALFARGLTVMSVQGYVAFLVVAAASILMTLLASNTAAAVVMIPIVIQLGTAWSLDTTALTVMAAAALSLDFMVPVGTPPNAMAYGTGHISVAQMAKAGIWVSLAGAVLAASLAWWFW